MLSTPMDGSSATPFLPCMMENQEKGDRPAVAGLVNCAHSTRESLGYFLPVDFRKGSMNSKFGQWW